MKDNQFVEFKEISIGLNKYRLYETSFLQTRTAFLKVLSILTTELKVGDLKENPVNEGCNLLLQMLAKVNNPEIKDVETFLLKTIQAYDEVNNKWVSLDDIANLERIFRKAPGDYFQVLGEAIRYHFLALIPTGVRNSEFFGKDILNIWKE